VFISSFPSNILSKTGRHIEYQLMLLATINGIEFKCMLDAVLFDHHSKTIYPIDIKTGVLATNSHPEFMDSCYYFYNYYIQAGIYRKVLIEYFKYHENYKDYKVQDFRFVYSTTNPKHAMKVEDPFTFILNEELYVKSFTGFKIPGYTSNNKNPREHKPGIAELFMFYKDNVVNPSKREDLLKEIEVLKDENLPF
jgi:hypothetical protein